MTKSAIPLFSPDTAAFTRALSRQLGQNGPSHLKLMNMVARSAGFQNIQHMRVATAAQKRLERPANAVMADARAVERATHHFDDLGRLRHWPSRRAVQTLALWALWATLPAGRLMSESEINDRLATEHCFGDPATLRRTMIGCKLLKRKVDCSEYRRLESEPPEEAKALIRALRKRRKTRAASAREDGVSGSN